ncbi:MULTISPECIES: MFS transporter [Chelativorans]|jgi:MFS family permease|uniref:Major facilitator superfamily MFS_1 n=1 Tax=Chelativorans sp. (strain BNC1) TaxID=266779 RepID=Q11D24_CHESB|nr:MULTISPECIES: MFS transporter [Chelativorans]
MSGQNALYGRWAVAAFFFANGFITGSWAPEIPVLVARFSLTESALGLLIMAFGLGAVAAMPLCGYLIGRFGSRPVSRGTGVLCCLSLAGIAAAPSLPFLAIALIFFGALLGGMDVAMNSNAVVVERRLQRAIMSSSHGFWSLGGFAGAGIGGLMIERWGYVAHISAVTVFALLLVLLAMTFLVAENRPVISAGNGKRGLPRGTLVYITGLIALFCMIPEGAVLDWAALYLQQEMGADYFTASLPFAAFAGVMAVMRFLGDGVRNRLGAVTTMRISAGVAAIGMLCAGFAPNAPVATLAFAFAGLGVANMVPIVFSAAGNQPGISSAAGMSVATTMGYSGILFAPSLIGFVAEHTGFSPIFIGFAFVLGLVFMMADLVRPADQIAPQPAPST